MKLIKSILFFLWITLVGIGNNAYSQNDQKIVDKVVAIVGENAILYSDIENQYLQYLMQGNTANSENIRCQIFEELLFGKLLLNQAQLDSIEISDDQVESEMDRRLQYFISQIGSQEELEKYYNKSIAEIKNDLRSVIREQILTQQVKGNITSSIKITPSEVKKYYNDIPKDSLPLIGSEIKYAVITKKPVVTAEEKAYAKQKIQKLRDRIMKGEDFATLAKIYSEDPGSALKGGELGDFSRGVMYPEFEAAAFALQKGEVSPVIETDAGYHILKLIKRKGEYINVRHILIQTKVSPLSIKKTQLFMDSVYQLIASGKMTFEEAALKFSDDDYRSTGGVAINPNTGNNSFTPQEIDKDLFFKLDKMDVGGVSKPLTLRDDQNKAVIKIVKLVHRTSPHKASLKTDYGKIQEVALQQKKADAISDWINERTAETYILIVDKKLKQCKFMYHWF